MPARTTEVRDKVLRLFEDARKAKGAFYEPERFMAFLHEPPLPPGRSVAGTATRFRFARFMISAEQEFGVCFTNQEWDRGFSLDEFVEHIETKLANPQQGHRFACRRLAEARSLDSLIMMFVFLTLLFLVPVLGFRSPMVRIVLVLCWAGILATVSYQWLSEYGHYKKIVDRTRDRTG